jgi:hypothetical protein
MYIFQNILVFVIASLAAAYLVTKFIWTPSFLKKKSASKSACGDDGCGCH